MFHRSFQVHRSLRLAILSLTLGLSACGPRLIRSDADATSADGTVSDTAAADTGLDTATTDGSPDIMAPDASMDITTPDTPGDTVTSDTPGDLASPDSSVDAAPADTLVDTQPSDAVADTALTDTSPPDTAPTDARLDAASPDASDVVSSDAVDAIDVATIDIVDAADAGCATGTLLCGTRCIDPLTDRSNCGACGRACAEFEACNAGTCGPNCMGTTVCGPVCHDLTRDNLNCGSCGMACPVISNGVTTCRSSACVTTCNTGYALVAGACTAAAPTTLRLVRPVSGSTVTNTRPVLGWSLPAGATGARVDICADRACTTSLVTFDAVGAMGSPPMALTHGVRYWRATALAGSTPVGTPSSVWALHVRASSAAVNTAWGTDTDFNGDGFDDVVVTSAMSERMFVYNGGSVGIPTSPSATITPPAGSTFFGYHVASAGDVNGDGYSDAVVTWYGAPARILIYHGGPAGLPATASTTLIDPSMDTTSTASLPWGVGDINGDGFGDLSVTGLGMTKIYYGSPTGLGALAGTIVFGPPGPPMTFGWPPDSQYGTAFPAGDADGDGFADIAIRTRAGLELHRGANTGLALVATQTLTGQVSSAAPANDVNNDGYADIVFVTLNPTVSARVHHGSAAGWGAAPATTLTVVPTSLFIFNAVGVRDTNGDGFDDVAMTLAGTSGGTVWMHHGSASGVLIAPARTITAAVTVRGYGRPIVGAGDIDRDGFDDLLIGAVGSGIAYLHRGSAAGVSVAPNVSLVAPAGTTGFGSSMASRESPPWRRVPQGICSGSTPRRTGPIT